MLCEESSIQNQRGRRNQRQTCIIKVPIKSGMYFFLCLFTFLLRNFPRIRTLKSINKTYIRWYRTISVVKPSSLHIRTQWWMLTHQRITTTNHWFKVVILFFTWIRFCWWCFGRCWSFLMIVVMVVVVANVLLVLLLVLCQWIDELLMMLMMMVVGWCCKWTSV